VLGNAFRQSKDIARDRWAPSAVLLMVSMEIDTTRTQPSRMLGMFPHPREVTERRMIWFREKISHGSATATT